MDGASYRPRKRPGRADSTRDHDRRVDMTTTGQTWGIT